MQSCIIRLGLFGLFPSIYPSITIPVAASLLLACVRFISFVSFLLFVSGIFPVQSLPALLRLLYVVSSCFSVFFSTITLQKLQVILYHFYVMILDPEPYSITFHIVVLSSVSSKFCLIYFSVIRSSMIN